MISLISILGLLTIYSSTYLFFGKAIFFRQLIWFVISFSLLIILSRFNYQRFWDIGWPLYILSILLLVIVLILGDPKLGAKRWLQIYQLNFQPSELVKFSLIVLLSRYYSRKSIGDLTGISKSTDFFYSLILPFSFILIPFILILMQPDLGTAVILLIVFIGILFVKKVKPVYIFGFILSLILFSPFFFFLLKDYQKQRLLVFLNPNYDPLGIGYTIIQSKIAIGAGRVFGKGWFSGTQSQLKFLPAAYTDFIFASFAEEWGFLGCVILIFFFYQLMNKIFSVGEKITEPFGKLISYGILFLISSQVFINICMSLGLLPVVGIPLPFFSYGGSHLLINFISMGVLLNISKRLT